MIYVLIFSRTLLKAQVIGTMFACVTRNGKVKEKPNSSQEETSES